MAVQSLRKWKHSWDLQSPSRKASLWRRLTGPQLFVSSFILLILLGTLGLKLIPGLFRGEPLSWLDSCFTITSAVCVTGLIVVDTATYFTPAGQAWILLFIQLGGLGIITFATLLLFALGRRLSLRGESISASSTDIAPEINVRQLTRDIILFTLSIEALGTLVLYFVWTPGLDDSEALWHATFHSVSAFCNAGFSTYSDNLMSFNRSPGVLLVIGGLVIAGGLGFLTLEELHLWRKSKIQRRRRRFQLSVHSKLVLTTTGLLLLGGTVPFALLEWDHAFKGLPSWLKWVNALFLSITPRTAGFNSIDYGQASDGTNFLTILLMSIGGSPGSTAGGLKTTTFALLWLLAWARFHGHEVTNLWSKTIPEETIQRAVGLTVVVMTLMAGGLAVLTVSEARTEAATEPRHFLQCMFEVTSAFNTVGLSMGITPKLSPLGKMVMIGLMFVGRVGPVSMAAALAVRSSTGQGEFRYAYAEVAVG